MEEIEDKCRRYVRQLSRGCAVLCVSARAGQIALDTSRAERFWNWFGAIPHWIYITPLRAQAEGAMCAASFWRRHRGGGHWLVGRAAAHACTPPLRHRFYLPLPGLGHMASFGGLVGGVTLVTFIASGWLSTNTNR